MVHRIFDSENVRFVELDTLIGFIEEEKRGFEKQLEDISEKLKKIRAKNPSLWSKESDNFQEIYGKGALLGFDNLLSCLKAAKEKQKE